MVPDKKVRKYIALLLLLSPFHYNQDSLTDILLMALETPPNAIILSPSSVALTSLLIAVAGAAAVRCPWNTVVKNDLVSRVNEASTNVTKY